MKTFISKCLIQIICPLLLFGLVGCATHAPEAYNPAVDNDPYDYYDYYDADYYETDDLYTDEDDNWFYDYYEFDEILYEDELDDTYDYDLSEEKNSWEVEEDVL